MHDLSYIRSYRIQLPPPLPYHFPHTFEDDEHNGRDPDVPYRYVAGGFCFLGGTGFPDSDPTSIVLKLIWSLDWEHVSAIEAEFDGLLFDEDSGARLVPEPEDTLRMTMAELFRLLYFSKGQR